MHLRISLLRLVLENRQTNHWMVKPVMSTIPSPPLFLATLRITLITFGWVIANI